MSKRYRFTEQEMKLMQDFINTIDEELVLNRGHAFQCCVATKEIWVSNKRQTKFDNCFMEWLKTLPEYEPIHNTIIALLHEIGHIKTYDSYVYLVDNTKEQLLRLKLEQGKINEQEIQFKYFELDKEKNATLWGLNYYKSHKTQCNKLAEMLGLITHNLD